MKNGRYRISDRSGFYEMVLSIVNLDFQSYSDKFDFARRSGRVIIQ